MINQPLLDFIKQQFAKGSTKEKIMIDLLANGWDTGDVEEGFAAITPKVSPVSPVVSRVTPTPQISPITSIPQTSPISQPVQPTPVIPIITP